MSFFSAITIAQTTLDIPLAVFLKNDVDDGDDERCYTILFFDTPKQTERRSSTCSVLSMVAPSEPVAVSTAALQAEQEIVTAVVQVESLK
jgi:hypothetical protein